MCILTDLKVHLLKIWGTSDYFGTKGHKNIDDSGEVKKDQVSLPPEGDFLGHEKDGTEISDLWGSVEF